MLSVRFSSALNNSFELHKTRKAISMPSFAHQMSVCSLVLETGSEEDQVIHNHSPLAGELVEIVAQMEEFAADL